MQCLDENLNYDEWTSHNSILDYINSSDVTSGYQIKKYADKLKDIVCLLIGCTRDDLESHDFKDKELGEEWWRYQIIWESKPALNTHLHLTKYEAERAANIFTQIHGRYKIELVKLTPRLLLQLLGTDCGRDIIHPNIWVNSLFADYQPKYTMNSEKWNKPISNWIVTDVRFENEAQAIKDRGGVVIRVERGYQNPLMPEISVDEHPSETSLDNYEFDHVIQNDGSIEELIEKVKQLNLV